MILKQLLHHGYALIVRGDSDRLCAKPKNSLIGSPPLMIIRSAPPPPSPRRRFGYRRLFILLRREGEPSGLNRIHRIYREEGLTVRKRRARRKALGCRAPILVEAKPNARWSLDFVHDQFANGLASASSTSSTMSPRNVWAPFLTHRSRAGVWRGN
ncbi:transposase InsO family protein [Bradyrhizobium sp. USDA 4503]